MVYEVICHLPWNSAFVCGGDLRRVCGTPLGSLEKLKHAPAEMGRGVAGPPRLGVPEAAAGSPLLPPPARLAWVMPFGESGPRGLVQPQQSASSLAPAPGVRSIGQDTGRPVLGRLGKRPALSRADDTSRLWRLVPWERVSATSSSSVGDAPGDTEDACFAGADACAG